MHMNVLETTLRVGVIIPVLCVGNLRLRKGKCLASSVTESEPYLCMPVGVHPLVKP